ncbi:MAG: hypothetical protein DRQ55_04810 [Planctomycetota bacterium]|nr:MAG: hypothetical protein DRQ55_04810 [Planctomycetota bacterium]
MWTIPLSELDYDTREEQAVQAVLSSRWLSMGPQTEAFEREFAQAHGAPHAVALQSGTAALYLALRALGIGAGDEVVLPALTFVASAHAVMQCGAVPVLADVSSARRPLLDPADAARRIGPRTRALLPVHYGGALCDMPALRALADQHELLLIEDAAHAAGAPGVGQLSDAACFSFYANKNLATGEGGMLLTARDELASRCRALRSHGRSTSSHDKASGHTARDDVTLHGVNARMTEVQAALGRVQLGKLAAGNARRRDLRRLYMRALGASLEIPLAGDEEASACHLMVVLLPTGCDREVVRTALATDGIQTSVHYPPIHQLSAFADARPPRPVLSVTEALAPRLLSLPLHARLSDADAQRVADALLAALTAESPSERPRASSGAHPAKRSGNTPNARPSP